MAQYFIRKFDDDLYRRLRMCAARDSMTVKAALLRLITLYVQGKTKIIEKEKSILLGTVKN